MSWNLTKSKLSDANTHIIASDFIAEFKETHLGPLKNPLGRTTSTSTIKAETPPELLEEAPSITSSNGIGRRCNLSVPSSCGSLTQHSCIRGLGLSTPSASEAWHPHSYSSRRKRVLTASSVPTSFQFADAEFVLWGERIFGSWVHAS